MTNVEKKHWHLLQNHPKNLGQTKQCDVVKEAFGVRGEVKNINSEVGAFSLFVSDEILNIIVQNTNKHIENTMSKLPQEILCNSNTLNWKPQTTLK